MTIQTDVAPLAASRGVVRLPLGRERMRAPALLEHEAQPEQHEPVRFDELKPEPSVDDQEISGDLDSVPEPEPEPIERAPERERPVDSGTIIMRPPKLAHRFPKPPSL